MVRGRESLSRCILYQPNFPLSLSTKALYTQNSPSLPSGVGYEAISAPVAGLGDELDDDVEGKQEARCIYLYLSTLAALCQPP